MSSLFLELGGCLHCTFSSDVSSLFFDSISCWDGVRVKSDAWAQKSRNVVYRCVCINSGMDGAGTSLQCQYIMFRVALSLLEHYCF
jgi:hypothetical protein